MLSLKSFTVTFFCWDVVDVGFPTWLKDSLVLRCTFPGSIAFLLLNEDELSSINGGLWDFLGHAVGGKHLVGDTRVFGPKPSGDIVRDVKMFLHSFFNCTYGVSFAKFFLHRLIWSRVFRKHKIDKVNFHLAMLDELSMLHDL
jgi:hypothetical protein